MLQCFNFGSHGYYLVCDCFFESCCVILHRMSQNKIKHYSPIPSFFARLHVKADKLLYALLTTRYFCWVILLRGCIAGLGTAGISVPGGDIWPNVCHLAAMPSWPAGPPADTGPPIETPPTWLSSSSARCSAESFSSWINLNQTHQP